ncbi:type I polyketide synthase [Pseudomonas piscis]
MDNDIRDVSKDQLQESLAQAITTIRALKDKVAGKSQASSEPIAIVGLGCRLPGNADTPRRLWNLLKNATDAVGDMPSDRLYGTDYYDPDPQAPGKAYVMRGGFIDAVDQFDPTFFGISPKEAQGMDPQQRLALEVAWEALEHAAIAPDSLHGKKMGVFMGVSTNDYVRLRQQLGAAEDVNAYQFYGETSFVAGRIAYTLGSRGPAVVLDTSCSSSLVALHQACASLRNRESDVALAGGVNLILSPYGFVLVSKLRAVAPDGRCKTFDAAADGYGRAEGCVILALKRLSDAVRDQDPVMAVIEGSAVNNDGASSGITVPNIHAQEDVIRLALGQAGIAGHEVDYVEAHGTGTALGDPIELRALHAALGTQREADAPLLVGSIKANMGHLEPVAGITGLAKILLCMQQETLVPQVHFHTPNPRVEWDRLALKVVTEATAWPRQGKARHAGVSSFGVTGTNAHVVVGDPPPRARGQGRGNPWQLLTLSAKGETPRRQIAGRYERFIADNSQLELRDLCYTANVGRSHFGHRFAAVADSREGLREQLAAYASRKVIGQVFDGRCQGAPEALVMLFPGQGCQYRGMAQALYEHEPFFKARIDECRALLSPMMEVDLLTLVLDGDPASEGYLEQTRYAQPAIFAVEYALARLWMHWGITPDAVFGHSFGEISAICVAGAISLADALRMVEARGRLAQQLMTAGGAMYALGISEERLKAELQNLPGTCIELAAVNSPQDVVIAGPEAEVQALAEQLRASGSKVRQLAVSHAFHTAATEPMLEAFRQVVAQLSFNEPNLPVIASATGQVHTLSSLSSPDYWCLHTRQAVRFSDGVATLRKELAVKTFFEVACDAVLTPLIGRHEETDDVVAIASMRRAGDPCRDLRLAAAQLYVAGHDLDWARMHEHDGALRQPLPSYAFQRQRYWFDAPSGASGKGASAPHSACTEGGALLGHPVNAPTPAFEATLDSAQLQALGAESLDDQVVLRPARLLAVLAEELTGQLQLASYTMSLASLPRSLAMHPEDRLNLFTELKPLPGAGWEVRCFVLSDAARAAGAEWQAVLSMALDALPAAHDEQLAAVDPAAMQDRAFVYHMQLPAEADRHGNRLAQVLEYLGQAVPEQAGGTVTGIRRWSADRAAMDEVQSLALAVSQVDPQQFDCTLYSGAGQPVGRLEGVSLGASPDDAASGGTLYQPNVLYSLDWLERPRKPADVPRSDRLFTLVSGSQELARPLVEQLQRAGHRAQVLSPQALLEAARIALAQAPGQPLSAQGQALAADIIVLDGMDVMDASATTLQGLSSLPGQLFHPLLEMIRAVIALGGRGGRLWLVTRGANAVGLDPGQPMQVATVPLWGIGKTIALEHPEHWGALVDLAPGDSDWARALAEEIIDPDAEDKICLRPGKRYVQRLNAFSETRLPTRAYAPCARGSYLITGGMGGIGLAMAQWLLDKGAAQVVITGRRPLERVGAELQRFGEFASQVRYVQADITSRQDMQRVFADLAAAGHRLKGIFHAAGISIPQDLEEVDNDSFDQVMRPKVEGTWLLHELSLGLDLDFFVMCSTIASVWGSQHVASYAAANQFLDGLAWHRQRLGLSALVIDWGLWAGGSHLFDEQVLDFLTSVGLKQIAPAQNIGLLSRVLASDLTQLVVSGVDWNRFKPLLESRGPQPLLEYIRTQAPAARPADSMNVDILEQLSAVDEAGALALLDDYVWEQYAQLLGVKTEQVRAKLEDGGSLMDYGLDSLLVMDMVARCRRDLKLEIKAREFLECPGLMWPDFLARSIREQGCLAEA